MSVLTSVSAVQASTNTSTLVTGSILNTSRGLSASFTIINTGANTISWILYGGNKSDLSDKVTIKATADITANSSDSYANSLAPFKFYGVYIISKVSDTPGEATINGICKG